MLAVFKTKTENKIRYTERLEIINQTTPAFLMRVIALYCYINLLLF